MWVGMVRTQFSLMRTSWSDPNAIYVAMKGGSPNVNHAHMDSGSFIMEADGVRWAMDFGSQDYNSLESKGVDLWNMNRIHNDGKYSGTIILLTIPLQLMESFSR